MNLIPIKVECHSGYIADEYPISFFSDNVRFEIKEVIDRWYQGGCNAEGHVAKYYKVCVGSGRYYVLKHDIEMEEWYLILPDKPGNLYCFPRERLS